MSDENEMRHRNPRWRHKTNIKGSSSLLEKIVGNSQSKCFLDGGQFATPDLRYFIPEESRETEVDLSCPPVSSR